MWALALQSVIDQVELDQKSRPLAQRVKLTHWYESSSYLVSVATQAFNEGVHELLTRFGGSQADE